MLFLFELGIIYLPNFRKVSFNKICFKNIKNKFL
jgi:hypothetical protein